MSGSEVAQASTFTTTTVNIDLHLRTQPVLDLSLQFHPSTSKVKDIWLVENHVKNVFTTVALGFIGTVLCSVGLVGNIVNVAVFCRMGFKVRLIAEDPETINISFLGLAVADIGCLATQLWLDIMYIPAFRDLADWLLPFDPADPTFRNVTAAWPHICFSRSLPVCSVVDEHRQQSAEKHIS
ncbi:chemosensory receptor B [Elysia marginata]|uniref:Chemosensory receptor B n=1 Tax=Elysia marginata TaxID=1093978 RepID=A0AAV4EQV6_9GAST|nr:chemosensory receptor B [Elysia marginata]